MEGLGNPIPGIQEAKHNGTLIYNPHGLRRMLERNLTMDCVLQALDCPRVEILENNSKIGRQSPDCLLLGTDGTGRVLHVLVAYPQAEVITVYEPTLPKWINPRERAKR